MKDAEKVLREVWNVLGPLPTPSCSGCAAELEIALRAIAEYFDVDPTTIKIPK